MAKSTKIVKYHHSDHFRHPITLDGKRTIVYNINSFVCRRCAEPKSIYLHETAAQVGGTDFFMNRDLSEKHPPPSGIISDPFVSRALIHTRVHRVFCCCLCPRYGVTQPFR